MLFNYCLFSCCMPFHCSFLILFSLKYIFVDLQLCLEYNERKTTIQCTNNKVPYKSIYYSYFIFFGMILHNVTQHITTINSIHFFSGCCCCCPIPLWSKPCPCIVTTTHSSTQCYILQLYTNTHTQHIYIILLQKSEAIFIQRNNVN